MELSHRRISRLETNVFKKEVRAIIEQCVKLEHPATQPSAATISAPQHSETQIM